MLKPAQDAEYFLHLQTKTGWGRVLARFRDWIDPPSSWLVLDVGCGPGLMPALLAQRGCRSLGMDYDIQMFSPTPLHPQVVVGNAIDPPFPERRFDLITISNLLFMLPEPARTLQIMAELLQPAGQIATLNPSEALSMEAAEKLVEARDLSGLAARTLLNWAERAEAHNRWTAAETAALFAAADLELIATRASMGPGFARFARGQPISARQPLPAAEPHKRG